MKKKLIKLSLNAIILTWWTTVVIFATSIELYDLVRETVRVSSWEDILLTVGSCAIWVGSLLALVVMI